jgi:hypothetical protein
MVATISTDTRPPCPSEEPGDIVSGLAEPDAGRKNIGGGHMSQPHTVAEPLAPGIVVPAVSVKQILPWLLFTGVLFLVVVYFLSTEQGATSLLSGTAVHEWLHDGRHLLGFPCH